MVFPWFSYGFPVHCLSPLMNKPYGVAAVAGLACATCSAALLTAPSASLNSARETPPSWPNSGDVRPRHYKLAIYIIYNMYVWMYCMYVCIYIYILCKYCMYIYIYKWIKYKYGIYIYIYRCACDRTIVFKYWVIIIPKWCVYINIYIHTQLYIYIYIYIQYISIYGLCIYIYIGFINHLRFLGCTTTYKWNIPKYPAITDLCCSTWQG